MGRSVKKVLKVGLVVAGAVLGGIYLAPLFGGGLAGLAMGAVAGAVAGAIVADTVNAILNPNFGSMDSGSSALNDGIILNKQGTNNNIPVIYGKRTVGGIRAFVGSGPSDNKYLYIAQAFSEGEINAFKKIYINDELVWEGTTTHGTKYTSGMKGKFPGYFEFQAFHGTDNQTTNNGDLLKECQGWTNNHRGRGIAYLGMRCKWFKVEKNEDRDKTPWTGGLPTVKVELEGRKVADATGFADSVTRATAYENETETYNTNNISCLLDYLRNPIYGKGIPNSAINFKSFRDEATRFNKDDTGSTLSNDLQQQCNAIVFTERTVLANVKEFLKNARGAMPFVQGRYKINLEDNRSDTSRFGPTSTSVMTVDEDMIISGVKLESENIKNKYNSIVVSYRGSGDFNEPIELQVPEVGSAEEAQYLSEDNNKLNQLKLDLNHVTQGSVAEKHAEVLLARSRYRGKTLGFQANALANELEVNDIITVQYSGLGIDGKYRIRRITMNPDYTFGLLVEEHNDNTYAGNPNVYIAKTFAIGWNTQNPTLFRKADGSDWTTVVGTQARWDKYPFSYVIAEEGGEHEALQAIANGTYIFESQYDVIYPDMAYDVKPNILRATIENSPTHRGSLGLQKDITIYFDPITEPSVESVDVYAWHENSQTWAGIAEYTKEPQFGKVVVHGTNPYYPKRLVLRSDGLGEISNEISITTADMLNNTTVYAT